MPNELALFAVTVAGGVVVLAGFLWLVVRAFRTRPAWGFATMLLPGVGGLAFLAFHFRAALRPHLVMLLGVATAAAPPVVMHLLPEPPKVAVTTTDKGEVRGTLTGATETGAVKYLAENRELAVVQMANRPDVTDATLERLKDMPNLRELDLNDTPITDAGAAVLAGLPKLEAVRIARTKITPAGVAKVLANPAVKKVDVGGLGVPGKVLRDWKNADPQNRSYVN